MSREWQMDVEDGLCLGEGQPTKSVWTSLVSDDPLVILSDLEGMFLVWDKDKTAQIRVFGPRDRVPSRKELIDLYFGGSE